MAQTNPVAETQAQQTNSLTAKARKLSNFAGVAITNVTDNHDNVSKRVLVVAIALTLISSAYYGITRNYESNRYFSWVYCFVATLQAIVGTIVIAGYARPSQIYDTFFYVGSTLIGLAVFASLVYRFIFGGPVEYYLSVLFFFFLFIHVSFGKYGEEDGEAITFSKYLMPPVSILMSLGYAFMPSNKLLGDLFFVIGFVAFVVVAVVLMAFDKPIDKTKRKTIAEDGTTTTHIIANNGYYFSVRMI